MILKKVLDLRMSIDVYRRNMIELATIEGVSNPEVIRLSQELDEKIIRLQKILCEIHSLGENPPSFLFK